jgi:hypothetical protein
MQAGALFQVNKAINVFLKHFVIFISISALFWRHSGMRKQFTTIILVGLENLSSYSSTREGELSVAKYLTVSFHYSYSYYAR